MSITSQSGLSFPPRGPRHPDLKGKCAIVTGGGRGIGKAIAARLAREGVAVALAGRSRQHLEQAAAEIAAAGGRALAIVADVGDAAQVDALFEQAAALGPLDILVNNAALMVHTPPAEDVADQHWRQVLGVNLDGPWYCAQRAARALAGRGGAIINISTVGAVRPHYGMLAYDVAKAGLDGLTRALGVELAPKGIRVNAVAPGRTWNTDQPYDPGTPEVRVRIPIGRGGHSEEIASVVAFLASDEASYIVGQTICVDGGLTVQLTPRGQWV